jgi:hypothetical protein
MPASYFEEFRRRAIALVRSGWSVTKTAHDLGVVETLPMISVVDQDRGVAVLFGLTLDPGHDFRIAQPQFHEPLNL